MFKIVRKSITYVEKEKGESVVMTEVMLLKENPFVQMQYRVEGDLLNVEDEILIAKVLDAHYSDVFPSRAENEKFSEIDEKLEEMNESIAENRKLKEELEMVQMALLEFMNGGKQHETESIETESDGDTSEIESV